jgi:hypothetical protein
MFVKKHSNNATVPITPNYVDNSACKDLKNGDSIFENDFNNTDR